MTHVIETQQPTIETPPQVPEAPCRKVLLGAALSYLGNTSVNYSLEYPERGTTPETGFDSAGFVQFVLRESGLAVPDYLDVSNNRKTIRHVNEFWDHFGIQRNPAFREPGDLIFFSKDGVFPTHMGVVVDREHFVHAPTPVPGRGGLAVRVDEIEKQPIIENRDSCQRFFEENPIGYKTPTIPLPIQGYRYTQQPIQ